jgi:transcriptional regulator with XRE-family HTH domain
MKNEKTLKIANRVVALRQSKDISQAELARRIGLTKGAVSQFERGIIGLTAENVGEIARVLITSADYLIFGKEDPKAKTLAKSLFQRMLKNEKFQQIVKLTEDPEIDELMSQLKNYLDLSE